MPDCKTEIISTIPDNSCCSQAFLSLALNLNANIDISESYILFSGKAELLDKLGVIVNNFYPDLEINRWEDFLLVSGNLYSLLRDNFLLQEETEAEYFCSQMMDFFPNECDRLTLLKTLFVLRGNFYYNDNNNKNSTGYNLEFVFKDERFQALSLTLLRSFGFDLKDIKRQNMFVVYTKNSNVVCDLFARLGATSASLDIQNNLAIREVRNSTNRQNNCFDFNLNKTLDASAQQMEAINFILDNYSLDYLEENLREVALARLCNPDQSLSELQLVLGGKISRAGIKYRLDKIIDIYKKLKGDKV